MSRWSRRADRPENSRGVPDLTQLTDPAASYHQQHLDALRDGDFRARATASWGLIARGRESLPFLGSMLASRDPDSVADAAGVLAWLGHADPTFVDGLVAALPRQADHESTDAIVLALGALGSRKAVPALAALVRDDGTDGDTMACAVESLGKVARRRFDRRPDPRAAARAWLDAQDR
ncbi:hypothetical protein G5V58_14480 [Nocardioides anomalus]|uniref:HEAT repeat domain-containing protein n=1 Tax=Nocardioides anomalus TaxID=2712223 RepID=A0A6G6WFE0_9ACTN|nr:hypothetical protein [Nocardioides anomalus]QIG43815.1 hypothetical protein G5V58_14480 [Nocardioides anomalus]